MELKGTPLYFESLYELGEIYWKHAQFLDNDKNLAKEAEEKWQSLLQTKGINEEWSNRANFALGEFYAAQQNFDKAMDYYGRVKMRQEVVTALKHRQTTLQSQAQAEALATLLKECQSRPDLKVEALIGEAFCLIRLKNYSQARLILQEIKPSATQAQSKILNYYYALSGALEGKEKETLAGLVDLEKRYPTDPYVEEVYWILSQNLLAKQQLTEAKVYLIKLLHDFPKGKFSSEAKRLLNELDETVHSSTTIISQEETVLSETELLQRAKTLMSTNALAARQYCDKIIASDQPDINLKVQAMWLAGEILSDQAKLAEAAGYFEMIETFFGQTAGQKAIDGLWKAGSLYQKAGMQKEAERVYHLLSERYPQSQKQVETALHNLNQGQ